MQRVKHEGEYHARSQEQKSINFAFLVEAMKGSKDNIILKWLDRDLYSLDLAFGCANQILLLMRNGRFELLPHKVDCEKTAEVHLGIRYTRFTHWAVMPCVNTPEHPIAYPSLTLPITSDIYSYGK